LGQVFRQRKVTAQYESLPQQPGSVETANFTERLGIAGPRLVEQVPNVWNFSFHNRGIQAGHIWKIAQNADGSITEPSAELICRRVTHGCTASPI
jgi:hypothetical protein